MKNKIIKLSFLFILVFSLMNYVKADFDCSRTPKHKIGMVNDGDDAGYTTRARTCSMSPTGTYAESPGSYDIDHGIGDTLSGSAAFADAYEWAALSTFWATDPCTGGGGKVHRCDDPQRKWLSCSSGENWNMYYDCAPGCSPYGGASSCGCTLITEKVPCNVCKQTAGCVTLNACNITTSNYCKVLCPGWACNLGYKESGACTPSYIDETPGETAWCVSPTEWPGKEYGEDPEFDISKCSSSYATTDCGFGNILTEAWYNRLLYEQHKTSHKITDKEIELALRLWGSHNTTTGFNNETGIGVKQDNGNGCYADHMRDVGFRVAGDNVYVETEKYITKNFLKYVSETYKSYLDPVALIGNRNIRIECNDKKNLICKNTASTDVSFGLFFNTLLGNSQMRNHMKEVFGTSVSAPSDIEVEMDEKGEYRIDINYGSYTYLGIRTNVEYDCSDFSGISAAERAAIEPYCKTKIVYKDYNGNETTVMPESCKGKSSLWCTSRPVKMAICDIKEWQRDVVITYPDNSYKKPVRLVSCGSTANQIMYTVTDVKDVSGGSSGGVKTQTFKIPKYNCNGTCTNSDTRTKDPSCDYNASKADGGVHQGFAKDPSLKCILNLKNESEKDRFDFSKEFGVNTNFCNVYCSDEVTYYIPDKITVKSGLAFKYDIGVKSYLTKTDNHLISNVVKSKRTCVSEIYYNKYFTSATNYEKMYNLDTEKDITNVLGGRYIQNWKDLYTVLKAKSAKERGRTENINELLYDLYNCNFYNKNSFGNVTKPKQKVFETNSTIDNVYDNMKKTYGSSNSYGFDNCTINGNSNDCFTMNRIDYSGGSEVTASTFVGKDTYINTGSVVSSNISEVQYCMGSSCFRYPDNVTANSVEDLETYNYSKYMKDSTVITDGKYKIPTNDYAIFSINTEFGFYNNSRFQTVQSTGYIKPGSNDPNYITLSEYSYPVSKNAYGTCKFNGNNNNSNIFKGRIDRNNNKDLGPSTNSSCVVTHKYDQIHTYKYRHDNDKFMNILLSSTFKNPNCYYDVEPSQVQCDAGTKNCKSALEDIAEYRNVERTNIFPNDEDVPAATNWDNENAKQLKDVIESTGKSVFTNPDFIQYSFTIGPDQIKSIRSYNNNNTSSYINTELNNCQVKDGMYFNCRSKFMDEIRNGNVDTSSTYATVNDNKDGSNLFE